MPTFSTVSAQRLLTCDHRLQRLFNALIQSVDHSILCGHRNEPEQTLAYETGHSQLQWPHSKHNATPSLAVDAQPNPLPSSPESARVLAFREFAVVLKELSARLGLKVRWGGDFHSWKDYAHWELLE